MLLSGFSVFVVQCGVFVVSLVCFVVSVWFVRGVNGFVLVPLWFVCVKVVFVFVSGDLLVK